MKTSSILSLFLAITISAASYGQHFNVSNQSMCPQLVKVTFFTDYTCGTLFDSKIKLIPDGESFDFLASHGSVATTVEVFEISASPTPSTPVGRITLCDPSVKSDSWADRSCGVEYIEMSFRHLTYSTGRIPDGVIIKS